jgi:hypothetical protein
MRKSTVFVFVILTVLSLSLTLVPHVSSQPANIKVLSYSWYIDSIGYFVVTGEVQNVGSSTIDTVTLSGKVYTMDGTDQADSFAGAFVKYLVPQQKAPFYMEFPPSSSATGDLSWLSLGVDRVDLTVVQAQTTTSYQYPDLTIKDSSGAADGQGVYWVTGTLQNTGTQTAQNIRVIGTFYNASGAAVGVSNTGNNPIATSLSPSGTISFRLGAWDLNQTEVTSNLKISSYLLLIQAEEPILSGTAPPPSTTTPTNTSPSSTEPSDSNPTTPTDSTPWSTYAIVAIIVIFGFVGAILLLRKRQSKPMTKQKSQLKRKQK